MTLIPSVCRPTSLVIVPWLEGGGAQGALEGLLRQLGPKNVRLVILFSGSRNHESTKELVHSVVELGCKRSVLGVFDASRKLQPLIKEATAIYSLMRASHLVLGILPRENLVGKRLAASFHQLPSQDSAGVQGKLEDILVRRGVASAGLITTPSERAVEELIERRFGTQNNTRLEHNLITVSSKPPSPPRSGQLSSLRLVFAGRLTEQKGLDRIPELLRGADVPVHLICLGDGAKKEELKLLLDTAEAPHTVELISHVQDVETYLDWCDAVFMPSRWELNPLVIWEARARGRGAITSDIDVFKDLSENGPVWTFSNAASFGDRVRSLAADETLRAKAFTLALKSAHNLNQRSCIVEYLDV